MSNTFETGHIKNFTNFNQLITLIQTYGSHYNPSKLNITLPALKNHANQVKLALEQVHLLSPSYKEAIAARDIAFAPLKNLSNRLITTLKATGIATQVVDQLIASNKKIQVRKTALKLNDSEILELSANGTVLKQNSTSQQSYDNQLINLDKQIKLLAAIDSHIPSDASLQLTTLRHLYANLRACNNEVIKFNIPMSTARLMRNNLLYKPESGLVDVALSAKSYVKSLYGSTSIQYKQIAGLSFRNTMVLKSA